MAPSVGVRVGLVVGPADGALEGRSLGTGVRQCPREFEVRDTIIIERASDGGATCLILSIIMSCSSSISNVLVMDNWISVI